MNLAAKRESRQDFIKLLSPLEKETEQNSWGTELTKIWLNTSYDGFYMTFSTFWGQGQLEKLEFIYFLQRESILMLSMACFLFQ